MMPWLPLGFAQPLVLLGLLSLPVLWWLLRLIPPQPRRIEFPPTRLLFDITPKEETPQRTPWWLTLLRLTLAALVIIAAAGPLWNPPVATSTAKAPLALLIDDGFPAAGTWDARMRTAEDLIARAEADNRGVALIPLSRADARHLVRDAGRGARAAQADQAEAACGRARRCAARDRPLPRRHAGRRDGLALRRRRSRRRRRIRRGAGPAGRSNDPSPWSKAASPAHARSPAPTTPPARSPSRSCARTAARPRPAPCARSTSRACRSATPPSPSRTASARPKPSSTLPVEIRNDIARLEIAAERSAGAVQLLDKRWRRRSIGVITGSSADTAQPLLASTYYLTRALGPFADVRLAERGSPAQAVSQFIEQRLPMLILADVGNVARGARAAHPLDRGRRRAGALRRPAARRRRRRSGAGEAAPRRPRARRQPVLGPAAAARRVLARKPVLRHGGADRRHREPPGAGGARRHADRAHLGDARRRHAAGHRRSAAARA